MKASQSNSIPELGHKLRNQLAVVISSIDLIQLRGLLTEEDKQALTVMQEKTGEISCLLNDLLTISQTLEDKNGLNK